VPEGEDSGPEGADSGTYRVDSRPEGLTPGYTVLNKHGCTVYNNTQGFKLYASTIDFYSILFGHHIAAVIEYVPTSRTLSWVKQIGWPAKASLILILRCAWVCSSSPQLRAKCLVWRPPPRRECQIPLLYEAGQRLICSLPKHEWSSRWCWTWKLLSRGISSHGLSKRSFPSVVTRSTCTAQPARTAFLCQPRLSSLYLLESHVRYVRDRSWWYLILPSSTYTTYIL
jgi:hypothetical protein